MFLLFAAGIEFLLLSFIIYAPGSVFFIMSRREQHRRVFSPVELVIFIIVVMGAIAGIAALATGAISI